MTIRLNGRDFSISTAEGRSGPRYILAGKRGALYSTMRHHEKPHVMFLITARGFGLASGFESVRLTDEGGVLRELR